MILLLNRTFGVKTEAALLSDGKLVEIYIAQDEDESTAGSVFVAKIDKIVPALEAAFVRLSPSENAFLRLRDIKREYLEFFGISNVVEGQKLLVQVKKESVGSKGPQVTTNVGLPGRYLVLLPFSRTIGVSRKLPSEDRLTLKNLANALRERYGMGVIIRTAALEANEELIFEEAETVCRKWESILSEFKRARKPRLLFSESDTDEFIIREFLRPEVSEVVTNCPQHREMVRRFRRDLPVKVVAEDVFERYSVDEKLYEVFKRRLPLPSGGEIVVDRTEALTVVDVNSGHCIHSEDHETLSEQINIEAAREICRVLRLRNVGGIVLVDFIDMKSEESKERVLEVLREEVSKDRNKVEIFGFTKLGLLEMARKRTSRVLDERVTSVCPSCGGSGRIANPRLVLRRVYDEIGKGPRDAKEAILKLHPEYRKYVDKEKLRKATEVSVHIHFTHHDPNSFELSWKV